MAFFKAQVDKAQTFKNEGGKGQYKTIANAMNARPDPRADQLTNGGGESLIHRHEKHTKRKRMQYSRCIKIHSFLLF